jgi:hypothetical protein
MKRQDFLKGIVNENNHRLLLWEALRVTKGDVVEYGSGHGSTKYLAKYCADTKRDFKSYDYSEEWCVKTGAEYVKDWNSIKPEGSVILIDHSPGERRIEDIKLLADKFEIMVIHDTEPVGAGDYKYNQIWGLFKYRVDVQSEGAWATAVSNTIDFKDFIGKKVKDYTITK